MVEIFKTNIDETAAAEKIKMLIREQFPYCLVNIDLDDCDKILRVYGTVPSHTIIGIVTGCNYQCEVLE